MRDEIRKILAENICVDIKDCTDEMNLEDDLGVDSLSLLAFGVDVADKFQIDESSLRYDLQTVGELLDYVNAVANS